MKCQGIIITLFFICLNGFAQTFEWVSKIGGPEMDLCMSTAVDVSGNIYVIGYFENTCDFDPGPLVNNMVSEGLRDIFILKLDASGSLIWSRRIGGTLDDIGISLVLDNTGNMYITGMFQGSVDFDPGPGLYPLNSAGDFDIFICKLNSAGNFIWAKRFGDSYIDNGYSITIDGNCNVYTTGNFSGQVDFDPGPGVCNLTSATSTSMFICKLDSSGNFVLAKQLLSDQLTVGNCIKVDETGNIYTIGTFRGTTDFDPGINTYPLTSVGYDDFYISKLDSQGNFLWAKGFGGSSREIGYSMVLDGSGHLFATGYFRNTVDFDPGTAIYPLTSSGEDDIFILKLDSDGNLNWVKQIGGNDYDRGASIAIDASNHIYLTGFFCETVDFDPGPGHYYITANEHASEFFTLKLNSEGNFKWAIRAGSPSVDQGSSVLSDDIGNVYLVGYFSDTVDFNPDSLSIFNLISEGELDAFVLKLSQLITAKDEFGDKNNISICPNPAHDWIMVEVSQENQDLPYNLMDVYGTIVKSGRLTANKNSIAITQLSPGIYFFNILDRTQRSFKIVKI